MLSWGESKLKGYSTEAPRGFSSPLARFILRRIGPLYRRKVIGVDQIHLNNPEVLQKSFEGYRKKEYSLLLAFRHVSKADAPVLAESLFLGLPRLFPQLKKQSGHRDPFWAHFLHGWLVLQWAGSLARWIFPRMGAIPVANHFYDRDLATLLKNTVQKGENPVIFAPEGQVTYYSKHLAPLTTGIKHFIHWNYQLKRNVRLIPIDIRYTWPEPEKQSLQALDGVFQFLKSHEMPNHANSEGLFDRIENAETAMFSFIWKHVLSKEPSAFDNKTQRDRLNLLREELASRVENYLILRPSGDHVERLFRMRGILFKRMIDEDVSVKEISKDIFRTYKKPNHMRALSQHYQLIQILDVLALYEPEYPQKTQDEYGAYDQCFLLNDLCNRISGGDINSRLEPKNRSAHILFGDSILFDGEQRNAKDARDLLKTSFEKMFEL